MWDLAIAAIVARVIDPASKLATARALAPDTAATGLGQVLDLVPVTGNEMLAMLDWLRTRQPWIERSLANRHHKGGTRVLHDVSSSDREGQCCPLAAFGYNRDGKTGRRQINCGLLCAADGGPVEVLAGNVADPATVVAQVTRIRGRFRMDRVAIVGDRDLLTTARIRADRGPVGLDWITALTTTDIRKRLRRSAAPPLVPGVLSDDAVAEITSPDFPGERLMVSLNPGLRAAPARSPAASDRGGARGDRGRGPGWTDQDPRGDQPAGGACCQPPQGGQASCRGCRSGDNHLAAPPGPHR